MLLGAQKNASLRALGTPAGMLVMVLQSEAHHLRILVNLAI